MKRFIFTFFILLLISTVHAQITFQKIKYSPDIFYEFIIKDNKVEKYIMTQPELKVTRELIRQ